jgi:hypothetical protein
MTPSPENEHRLEQLMDEIARDLPPRRAPRTLEARVLAEIERRAAQPWWRKSFAHWPTAARLAFLVFGVGVAASVAIGWTMAGVDVAQVRDAFAPEYAWVSSLVALGEWVRDFGATIVGAIPPLWIYGSVAVVAAMYAAFFGLGAAAYRTLYAEH